MRNEEWCQQVSLATLLWPVANIIQTIGINIKNIRPYATTVSDIVSSSCC